MNGAVRKALVIGGGFSGMSAALMLSRQGIAVDLVEIDPTWRCYGAGISVNGAMLRALRQMDLLDRFLEDGFAADGVEIRGPDDAVMARLPTPRVAGPDIPGGGAIMRPALATILSTAVMAAGIDVRLGVSALSLEEEKGAVRVLTTDGLDRRYDLVVGADGINSRTRTMVFPDAPKPRFVGQSVWRAVMPRPPGVETATMWLGQKLKVGLNRIGPEKVYLFLTEDRPTNDHVASEDMVENLRALLLRFPSPTIRGIARDLSDANVIVYRPLEQLLMPRPWHRGRTVLIGDAVHATTPHLAAGACLGVEDAIVLAEEIGAATSPEAALASFESRRFERCRMVVENSGRLAEIEIGCGAPAEHADIMRGSLRSLAEAI